MRIFALTIGLLLVAGFAFGADVDGKWTGSISTPGGERPVNYTFKADGTTLTGSTTGRSGQVIPIKEGKIDGNKISFSVTFDFGGQEMKMEYKGIVSADQIKLIFDMMGQPTEIILKRAE